MLAHAGACSRPIRTNISHSCSLHAIVRDPSIDECLDSGLESQFGIVSLSPRLVELGHADADD